MLTSAGGAGSSNGYAIAARTLAVLGIRHMYGVIGIPVTELASAAQVGYFPALQRPYQSFCG